MSIAFDMKVPVSAMKPVYGMEQPHSITEGSRFTLEDKYSITLDIPFSPSSPLRKQCFPRSAQRFEGVALSPPVFINKRDFSLGLQEINWEPTIFEGNQTPPITDVNLFWRYSDHEDMSNPTGWFPETEAPIDDISFPNAVNNWKSTDECAVQVSAVDHTYSTREGHSNGWGMSKGLIRADVNGATAVGAGFGTQFVPAIQSVRRPGVLSDTAETISSKRFLAFTAVSSAIGESMDIDISWEAPPEEVAPTVNQSTGELECPDGYTLRTVDIPIGGAIFTTEACVRNDRVTRTSRPLNFTQVNTPQDFYIDISDTPIYAGYRCLTGIDFTVTDSRKNFSIEVENFRIINGANDSDGTHTLTDAEKQSTENYRFIQFKVVMSTSVVPMKPSLSNAITGFVFGFPHPTPEQLVRTDQAWVFAGNGPTFPTMTKGVKKSVDYLF